MAVAPNIIWLFIGRLLSGITAASFLTAGAYIADVTPPEKRGCQLWTLRRSLGDGLRVGTSYWRIAR